jgi:hypothetical protein
VRFDGTSEYDEDGTAEFKTMLLERTRLLKGDLAGLEEETRGSKAEGAGRESSAPGHTAELASDES